MSATPQDFSIWSKLTGNPYPRTPEEYMSLAPHVSTFVNSIGRQGGFVPQPQKSRLSRAVDAVGKTALAAGMLAGGAAIAKHHMETGTGPVAEGLQNLHSRVSNFLGGLGVSSTAVSPEAAESNIQAGTPFETPVQLAEGQDELIGYTPAAHVEAFRSSPQYAQMRAENPSLRDIQSPTEPASMPQAVRASMDVTPPTTAQRFGQGHINPEIQVRQVARGAAPGTEARESLETKPVTESEKLVTSQSFAPSTSTGPSHEEIRDLDSTLLRSHGHMNREQRELLRNQVLSEKYGAKPKVADILEGQMQALAQSDANVYRRVGQHVAATQQGLTELAGLQGTQPASEYEPSGHMVQTGTAPAAKDFLRQGVEKMRNIAQLRQTGYDPEQKFGATEAPGIEQMEPAHHDLLTEQLQREAGRQAGRADIYKKLQAQRPSSVPQPTGMMAVHGEGFFHPSAYGRL